MPEHGVWSELTAGEIRHAKSARQGGMSKAFRQRLAARLACVCEMLPALPYEELHSDLASMPGDGGAGKHISQERSLVTHALRVAPAPNRGRVWIDMGGGRGCLSERLLHATGGQDAHIIVDWSDMRRSRVRDPAIRRRTNFRRIVVDIGQVDVEAEVAAMGCHSSGALVLVAMSKHLCGSATDLAIRQIPPRCRVLMAPCCHHLCNWGSYQGRGFLEEMGVSREEFEALCSLAPWASIDTDDLENSQGSGCVDESTQSANSNEDQAWILPPIVSLRQRWCDTLVDSNTPIDDESPTARRLLGQRCKLLLDAGRVHALWQTHSSVRFVRYTKRSVEDRLIIAR